MGMDFGGKADKSRETSVRPRSWEADRHSAYSEQRTGRQGKKSKEVTLSLANADKRYIIRAQRADYI
jgi:hypothetical protein